ncbi:hypothetical protein GIY23_12150 [Allosaccharopolyspora coralli]|uniref:Uncharacterized protein n=1 Tax=Allosaccharopolyspora coralli TaxID=2665642 RepID=A0A5Q3Q6E9_9PSEU|nr:hypothetical protein [Allosaccharopolyspora coralli]QGK70178.1 hypothetical protein GIY23_12150 [Allosaccharopolyspora coralli]
MSGNSNPLVHSTRAVTRARVGAPRGSTPDGHVLDHGNRIRIGLSRRVTRALTGICVGE